MSIQKRDLTQKRKVRERSNTPTTYAQNAYSKALRVHQQPEPEQERNQEEVSVRERLGDCLPTDTKTFLFALVAIVYLIAALIHFFGWTGDISMLNTLLEIVGGYKGLAEVTALVPRGKNGGPTSNDL